jgi:hypothetical protein
VAGSKWRGVFIAVLKGFAGTVSLNVILDLSLCFVAAMAGAAGGPRWQVLSAAIDDSSVANMVGHR